jgi:hypothetical protein
MSLDSYRRDVQHAQEEIARLQRDKSREASKIADLYKKIGSATEAATRARDVSSLSSKQREIQRYQDDVARAQKEVASLEEKIAREHGRMNDAQKRLAQEEARELQKQQREQADLMRRQKDAADRAKREHDREMREISSTLVDHGELHKITLDAVERLSRLPERITVLFLAASPLDQNQLRLDEECRLVGEMIRKSEHRDAIELRSWWATRPLDTLQAINEHKPRIVHFSGHGSQNEEIIFQNDQGLTKAVSKEAIVQMMAATGDIQLVFFNTCYSRGQAEAVVQHVSAAIGMNTSIGDTAARVFAAQFYSAIGFGLSVAKAFAQAKAALMLEGIAEQDTPELFLADGIDGQSLFLVRPPAPG